MCPAHYQRQRKGLALVPPLRKRESAPADRSCVVPGCVRPFLASGMCKAHYYQEAGHRTRARRGGGKVFTISRKDFLRLYAKPCFGCGSRDGLEFEHIIPIERGGDHSIGNLARLCKSCNASKNNMTWMEWRASTRPRAVALFGGVV